MARYETESKEKIHKDVNDRIRKAEYSTKHLAYTVRDSEIIADLSKKFRHESTADAKKEIKQAIQKASEKVSDVSRKKDQDLEEKIRQLGEAEEKLHNLSEDAQRDASRVARGSSKIKEAFVAREGLKQAELTALEDSRFTSAESERAGKKREQSEQIRQALKNQLPNTQMFWNTSYGLPVLDGIEYRKPIIKLQEIKKIDAEKAKSRKDAQEHEAELEDKRRRVAKKWAEEMVKPVSENDKYGRNFPGYDANRRPKYEGGQDQ